MDLVTNKVYDVNRRRRQWSKDWYSWKKKRKWLIIFSRMRSKEYFTLLNNYEALLFSRIENKGVDVLRMNSSFFVLIFLNVFRELVVQWETAWIDNFFITFVVTKSWKHISKILAITEKKMNFYQWKSSETKKSVFLSYGISLFFRIYVFQKNVAIVKKRDRNWNYLLFLRFRLTICAISLVL